MVSRKKPGKSDEGAGSILSTVSGPSTAQAPATLASKSPVAERLLDKMSGTMEVATGADPDFHRRDLWEAIEAGNFPEWELAVQVFTADEAASFPFDVLDPTKLVPEELVQLTPLGKMVLNRNPDNFFAETEQVAFCTAHIIPGIDFSNAPLLQGRIHSYVDTQLTRLGGANFHEIPINSPIAAVHNNQRDGMHRQAIDRGRVSYEPNSLAGGSPAHAGAERGFTSYPEPVAESKVRGNPELFADHYSQARLFFQSQSPVEQVHMANAFRFEITLEAGPSVLYDAVIVPDGADVAATLARDAHALDFVREQYRHCKPIMAVGAGEGLLRAAGVPNALPDGSADPALIVAQAADQATALEAFKAALAQHRSFARETDPPLV